MPLYVVGCPTGMVVAMSDGTSFQAMGDKFWNSLSIDRDGHRIRPTINASKTISKVLSMLRKAGRLTPEMIAIMGKWRHSGINVYCGPRIWPRNRRAMENLAGYTCPPLEDHPRLV